MNDLDKILEYISTDKNSGKIFTTNSVIKNILPEINFDEATNLIKQIFNYDPKIIQSFPTANNLSFCANGLTKSFLKNGGFTKIMNDHKSESDFEKEKKQLEFEKSKIDLELAKKMLKEYTKTKWFARIGAFTGLGLAILELVKWIIQ